MKPAAKAILVLSLLLAASWGYIVYSTVRGDRALRDARTEVAAADDKAVKAQAETADMRVIAEAEKAERLKQEAVITKQKGTIATLEAELKAQHDIGGVAVGQGADLATAYGTGAPIVAAAAVPALTSWYELTGAKIPPLLNTIDMLNVSIGRLDGIVVELGLENAELTASNGRLQAIDLQKDTKLTEHETTIAGIRADLANADTNIQTAQNAVRLGNTLAWVFGIIAAVCGGYIIMDLARGD